MTTPKPPSKADCEHWQDQIESGMDKAELFDLYHNKAFPALVKAYTAQMDLIAEVQLHLDELRDAWQRGCIHERDHLGGIRSNRNWDLTAKLAKILRDYYGESGGK